MASPAEIFACRSTARRLFRYTPPDCTSRRASLFDGARRTRAIKSTMPIPSPPNSLNDISVDGTSDNTASRSSTGSDVMSSLKSTLDARSTRAT